MNKWLVGVGLLVTGLYIVLGGWLLGDDLGQIGGLELNELGDFLTGVFGPLALLWLILGFLQQGIELRQTRETLALQTEELRLSVQQQRQMVEVAQRQFESERDRYLIETQAIFSVLKDSSGDNQSLLDEFDTALAERGIRKLYFRLINRGAAAKNVRAGFSEGVSSKVIPVYMLFEAQTSIPFWVAVSIEKPVSFDMIVSYSDVAGNEYRSVFRFVPDTSQDGQLIGVTVQGCPEA